MTSSRSTVADVIEYDPENKVLVLNMIEEILEIRQGVLPEVKQDGRELLFPLQRWRRS